MGQFYARSEFLRFHVLYRWCSLHENHNSLGSERPLSLNVKQSPNGKILRKVKVLFSIFTLHVYAGIHILAVC